MMASEIKTVLNVGSGPQRESALHPVFRDPGWREIRLDVDVSVRPDIVADIASIGAAVAEGSCDAVWSSHNIEHLCAHEAPKALAEFRRVLKADGFALITCPDLDAIARLIVAGRSAETIYHSAAGPIGVLDMLYGHSRSVAEGRRHMAHRTGFTADSLGSALIASGFAEVWVAPGGRYDLWAAALAEAAQPGRLRERLARGGLDFERMARRAA